MQPTRTYAEAKRTIPMTASCGFAVSTAYPDMDDTPFGRFGRLFPDAQIPSHDDVTVAALDALADAIVDKAQNDRDNSDVPAIIGSAEPSRLS